MDLRTLAVPRGDGWRPWSQYEGHTMRDALFVAGEPVATVEAFADEGPFFANALTPAGLHRRSAPFPELPDAVAWAEVMAGYRARRR